MKYNIKKLWSDLIPLYTCLMLAGAILSFSAAGSNDIRYAVNDTAIASYPAKSKLAQSTTSAFFRILKGHNATCPRACSGKIKSLSACLTEFGGYFVRQLGVAAANTSSVLSWIRPGYYIFLFIYALF